MESKKINQLATEMSPAISDLTIIGDPITGVSKKITLLQIADLFQTTGTVTSVAVTETSDALTITGSPITTAGTINIGFAGSANQYVRGDGALAPFPTTTGGGSSVSYYLNGSVNQGTFGGSTYYQMSKDAVIGVGTNFSTSSNGLIAQFITDANDPDVVQIPSGNWNIEFFMNVSSSSGALASFYVEIYKYNGSTFTLLATNSATPEQLTNTTTVDAYYTSVAMPTSALSVTDRLAIRIYANVASKTVTLYTEDNRLCQVVTTFSKGLASLNNLTDQSQYLTTGTSGTNFNIISSGDTHIFNLPVASATNTGKLSNTDWSTFNAKQAALSFTAPLVNTSNTISIPAATSLVDGYLDNLDWVNFNTAYNNMIVSAAVTGTTTKTLTLTQQDAGTITASWTDDNTDAVTSVFGRTGAVVAASGDYTTTQVTEGTNLYFTNLRAQNAITLTTTGTSGAATYSGGTLNIPQYQGVLTNPVTGTGTTNTLPKFTGTSAIGNSNITDTGSLITLGSNTYVTNNLGLGNSSLTQYGFRNSLNITGAGNSTANYSDGQIQSGVTGRASYYETFVNTAAAAFTNAGLYHYRANQSTFGAGSTVTSQYGFSAESTLVGATNNYGFFGNIPSGTNRWNLYMNGTAANYLAGALGIGATGLTGYNLRVSRNITGNLDTYGIMSDGQIQSDVTTSTDYFRTNASTQAAAFTLFLLNHYNAGQGTFGASSSVTSQCGFSVSANMIGATNNFGFRGQIPAGTNRWNLFMDGTANNYMAGSLGIGTTSLTGVNFRMGKNITGATISYGIFNDNAIQSDVTSAGVYYGTRATTQAATFTLTGLTHYNADQIAFGAGSTVTNQYGFLVNSGLTGATNNYGFYGNIASGTNRWNLYMNGSASNYLNGVLTIGTASPNASAKVQVDSTTQGFLPPRMTAAQRAAIATPATGLMVYQTDGVEGVYVYSGGSWKSLTMV